jgi:hypothetical protein
MLVMADSVARQTLDTARFYLAQAKAVATGDRLMFIRHLQTAIIYARSVTFHLQSEHARAPGFKDWWAQQEQVLRDDRRARFLLEGRNFALKEGPTWHSASHLHHLRRTCPHLLGYGAHHRAWCSLVQALSQKRLAGCAARGSWTATQMAA